MSSRYAAENFLPEVASWQKRQYFASAHIRDTMQLTTLAMKAAAFGRYALTDGEWARLLSWYGFDLDAFEVLRS